LVLLILYFFEKRLLQLYMTMSLKTGGVGIMATLPKALLTGRTN